MDGVTCKSCGAFFYYGARIPAETGESLCLFCYTTNIGTYLKTEGAPYKGVVELIAQASNLLLQESREVLEKTEQLAKDINRLEKKIDFITQDLGIQKKRSYKDFVDGDSK